MLLLCDDFIISILSYKNLVIPKHMNGFLLTRDLFLYPILSILLLSLRWVFRLPTLYWLPKLNKRPYKARFIANSSSCTTTILSKLLTSCLTAVKKQQHIFGLLKIPMKFSINLNLKTLRLLNCLLCITLPHHLIKDKLRDPG